LTWDESLVGRAVRAAQATGFDNGTKLFAAGSRGIIKEFYVKNKYKKVRIVWGDKDKKKWSHRWENVGGIVLDKHS
jgi:hypothetical protein